MGSTGEIVQRRSQKGWRVRGRSRAWLAARAPRTRPIGEVRRPGPGIAGRSLEESVERYKEEESNGLSAQVLLRKVVRTSEVFWCKPKLD